jgi:hypothetical protein
MINNPEILLYKSKDGQTKIDVRLENETVWLTFNQIAGLFERDKSVISRYLKNVSIQTNRTKIQMLQKMQQLKSKETAK